MTKRHHLPSTVLLGGLLLGLLGCDKPKNPADRRTPEEKTDQAAHEAGEDAYKITQKTAEAARQAAEKLKKAGREVREGWEEAKHNDADRDSQDSKK